MKINQSNYRHLRFKMYARKSQEAEDRQIESIPDQIRELTTLVKREGLIVVGEPITEAQSAFTPGRPGWREVINSIKDDKADGILVWQSSRCSRNYQDNGELQQLLEDGIIKAVKTKDALYTKETDEQFMLSLNLAMDHQFSAKTRDGVYRGNRTKILQKKEWGNKAKPGWLNMQDNKGERRWIETDPDRFPIVQKALKGIIYDGLTPIQALDKLNNEYGFMFLPTKKWLARPMSRSRWYALLNDEYLYGKIIYKLDGEDRAEVMGSHEPMINEKEFWLIQQKLGKKGKRKIINRIDGLDFAYRHIMKCGECGSNVTSEHRNHLWCTECGTRITNKSATKCPKCKFLIADMTNPRTKEHVYYKCTKHLNKKCSQKPVKLASIEDGITELLDRIQIDPDFMNWALENLHELNEQEFADQGAIKNNLQAKSNELDDQINSLVQLQIRAQQSNNLTAVDRYDYQLKNLEEQLIQVRLKTKEWKDDRDRWLEMSEETFKFACYAREWYQNGNTAQRTQILQALGSNITLENGKCIISGERPWYFIEKAKEEILEVAELNRTIEKSTFLSGLMVNSELKNALSLILCPRQDSNLHTVASIGF